MSDRYHVKVVSDPCSSGLYVVYDGYTGQAIKHCYFRDDAELAVVRLNSYEPPKGVSDEQ